MKLNILEVEFRKIGTSSLHLQLKIGYITTIYIQTMKLKESDADDQVNSLITQSNFQFHLYSVSS